MTQPHHPCIIQISLLPESYKTYRVLADRRDTYYPVLLTLSRPLSVFGLVQLKKDARFEVDPDNPQEVILKNTELEAIRVRFQELETATINAETSGQQIQAEAEAEDKAMKVLRDELNEMIRESNRTRT